MQVEWTGLVISSVPHLLAVPLAHLIIGVMWLTYGLPVGLFFCSCVERA